MFGKFENDDAARLSRRSQREGSEHRVKQSINYPYPLAALTEVGRSALVYRIMGDLSVGVGLSFAGKGRTLRRRCGQVRALERHGREELLVLRGHSLARLPVARLVAPSALVLRHLLPLLERVSVTMTEVRRRSVSAAS